MKRVLLILLVCLTLTGCPSWWPSTDPQVINDPVCAAWIAAPYQVTTQPLELGKYKNLKFQAKKDEQSDILMLEMSVDDFSLLTEMITDMENYIGRQSQELHNMSEFYKPPLKPTK